MKKPKEYGQDNFFGWLMSSPALLLLSIFVILPLVMGLSWSFTDKRLISPLPMEFVGLKNYDNILSIKMISVDPLLDNLGAPILDENGKTQYKRVRDVIRSDPSYQDFRPYSEFNLFDKHFAIIAKDPDFYRALINTTLYVVIIVPTITVISLFLALLVNQKIWGVGFFRVIYFIPAITSISVTSVVWMFLYNPDQGLINMLLRKLTLNALGNYPWLQSADTALLAVILYTIWQASGLFMVIFLGGLQDIPEHLYEAAKIDGANRFQTLIHIIIPQLKNTTTYVLITSSILGFRLFTQVDVMTKGGPQGSTLTLMLHTVNEGFRNQRIGYASAIAIVFFFIILFITFIQRKFFKSESAME
ncbi:MAG: sugar ABC transporter permease [Anaerolineaceae bacterium]|nr:sugar ABC transporter permease [Anaerolineaceae bacterium]